MTATYKKLVWSILGLSLALNVFAGGFAATHLIREEGRERPPRMERSKADWHVDRFSLFANMGRLSPEVREKVKQAMNAQESRIDGSAQELKNARIAVRNAMRAEPFDKAALGQAYNDIRKATLDFQTVVQDMAVDVIGELTPEQRKTLAERPRMHHKRDKH